MLVWSIAIFNPLEWTLVSFFLYALKISDGIVGAVATTSSSSSAGTVDGSGRPLASNAIYSTAADTDDIYKVPQCNSPVDPSKLPEGVLFQVFVYIQWCPFSTTSVPSQMKMVNNESMVGQRRFPLYRHFHYIVKLG